MSQYKKTKFASHIQYLFGPLFSRNVKKTYTNQSKLQSFSFCLKRNVSQTFKISSCKKVYIIYTTCFDECFLFHVITGRHYFYTNLVLPRGFVQPPCCCVFGKKSAFYVRYLHNNITMLLLSKVQSKASTS